MSRLCEKCRAELTRCDLCGFLVEREHVLPLWDKQVCIECWQRIPRCMNCSRLVECVGYDLICEQCRLDDIKKPELAIEANAEEAVVDDADAL